MAIKYCTDDCSFRLPHKRWTSSWLRAVAAAEGGYRITDLTYIFCSSKRLLEMNKQYLGHDYFTDVITFDYSDLTNGVVSGDVFIDVDTVRDNAHRYGARAATEMMRVVVHGVLHLCGQKDKTPRTNKQMHTKEDKYLQMLRDDGFNL